MDAEGQVWSADRSWTPDGDWGWESWADHYAPRVERDLASRGHTATPARGTTTTELYREYRYGRDQLKWRFRTDSGRRFVVRLHFVEPWFGVGGGMDCEGWRLFDIAINGEVLERDFDIWSRAGGDHHALVWEREVTVAGDWLTIHFPEVRSIQALVCGIEILAVGEAEPAGVDSRMPGRISFPP